MELMEFDKFEFVAQGKKNARTKSVFTFSGAIPIKSKVRSTTDTKWLDFGGVRSR